MVAASLSLTVFLFTWIVSHNRMERVHISRLYITRKGETRYFNVRLPRNTERIIAIETGLYMNNQISVSEVNWQHDLWIKYVRTRTMGLLKIQATGLPNIFYATEIKERERNTGQCDPSKEYYPIAKLPVANVDGRDYLNPVKYWATEPWTHGSSRLADPVDIICPGQSLTGYYRDEYGKAMKTDVEYLVQVYIWYKSVKQ